MYRWSLIVVFCAVAVCLENVAGQEKEDQFQTPEYILPCHKEDPDLPQCILRSFNHLRSYLVTGIEELGVQSIEPLEVPLFVMENNAGPVRVKAIFSDTVARGASNFTVNDVKVDLDNWKIKVFLDVPRIEIKGKYEVNGQVLVLPIRSKGDFWAAFENVSSVADIKGKIVKNKDGIRFMKIDSMDIDFQLNKSKFKIKDIVNLGNLLGEAINQFLNQNSNILIEEMKPAAKKSLSQLFKGILNNAFLKIPLVIWLKGV